MLYLLIGAFVLSTIAALWMAKLLGDAGAYKQAFMIVLIGTLGWCMPIFIQVFLLAGFITIAVQYWDEVMPAFVAWVVTAVAVFAISHSIGTDNLQQELTGQSDQPAVTDTSPVATTP